MALTNSDNLPPKRRTVEARREALEERKKQIEAQLADLNARERTAARQLDTRRKIIVGAAVLAHRELSPAFADALGEVLQAAVLREIDREVIADLLEPTTPSGSGQKVKDRDAPKPT